MEKIDQIIDQCIQGDELACKKMYEAFVKYVYALCIRYSIRQNDIKDVMQIIFIEIFKSLNRFNKHKASFKTWLTRISINKLIEFRKKNYSRAEHYDLQNESIRNEIYSNDFSEQILEREYILKILTAMPEKYVEVFNLFIIDGYSHREISEMLNISVGHSRIILARGRKWAKDSLETYLTST